jgi:hypothetical protein
MQLLQYLFCGMQFNPVAASVLGSEPQLLFLLQDGFSQDRHHG